MVENLEMVVLIDTVHNIEIVGVHRSYGTYAQGKVVTSVTEALDTARSWGFPAQGVIVRPSAKRYQPIYKNLTTEDELVTACTLLLKGFFARSLYIETDMRAHRCPPRQKLIQEATKHLIEQCQRSCPACTSPGFVLEQSILGLPCRHCGHATDQTKEQQYRCARCQYTETRPVPGRTHADPDQCRYCNP